MTIVDTTPRSFTATIRAIIKQSWPILVSQLASMAFGVLDTVMTGHASPTDLATLALSISIYITVFIGLMGVMHALIPIQAQYVGAGQLKRVGQAWGQGIWVSSAHAWETGENKDPILVLSSWSLMNSQDRAALELMGHLR